MKGIDMNEINRRASRGIAWVGKGALLSLGILAMLALVVVMSVLTAVMLMAIALPASTVRQKRDLRGRRDDGNTSEFSAPREVVAS